MNRLDHILFISLVTEPQIQFQMRFTIADFDLSEAMPCA